MANLLRRVINDVRRFRFDYSGYWVGYGGHHNPVYKKERRENYKPQGLKSFLTQVENTLKKHSEDDLIGTINQSMASNYRGVVWESVGKMKKSFLISLSLIENMKM